MFGVGFWVVSFWFGWVVFGFVSLLGSGFWDFCLGFMILVSVVGWVSCWVVRVLGWGGFDVCLWVCGCVWVVILGFAC